MPSSFIDRIAHRLGFVPQAQAQRALEQAQEQAAIGAARRVSSHAAAQQRSLLAALTTNDVSSWQADGLHINASTAAGLATARARSRDAAANNGYAKRFLGMVRSNVLGPAGVRYQARVKTADGTLKANVNARLEAAWAAWGARGVCDVTGRYTWRALQRLALRHVAVDGEVFIRMWPGRGPHGLQLQLLPADVVPIATNADLGNGRKVRQGVEVGAMGQVLAYHMRTDDVTLDAIGSAYTSGGQRLVRVPAEDVLHLALPDEAGQLRGVPWMATALKRMYQAADFASAGLNKARESAKRGGWISENPEYADGQGVKHLQDGEDSATGEGFATLHDGTWEKLPAGYTAQPFESDYPNIEYGQFIKDCLRDIASACDVAYITLGNDLEAVNYSSGQLGLEGERTTWLTLQQWLVDDFVEPLHRRWLSFALLAADDLQGLQFDRLDHYAAAARWQPHRWQPLDPLKTIEAQRSRIEARLTSPQRVIAETGDDPDEIVQELIEWQRKTAPLGPIEQPGATAKPAAQDSAPPGDRSALRLQLIATRGHD